MNSFNSKTSYLINLNHIYNTDDGWITYSIVDSIVTGINEQQITATEFILEQNYPNPFNPSTKISWQSPISSWQSIKLYDALGREIETIAEGFYEAGNHSKLYTAIAALTSGIYFYQLKVGNFVQTKKMMLIK
ncbi:MAG: T9SS type A sorting domain-containing protein [Ignavibacteriales bacterium]|nr:T9SS type A sorting domain-containing protein [Ignavibacteriales bacterium]